MTEQHATEKTQAPELLDVNDLARLLGVSSTTVRRMVERRELPFLKLKRVIRFRRSDVDEYLDRCRVASRDEYAGKKN